MYDPNILTRLTVIVIVGLWSSASCRHTDGPSPMSPSSPGARSPDSGTTTHPNGVDDTKTGEPIGPVSRGLLSGSPIAAREADGPGMGGDGSGGLPGLGGDPGGGIGGLPQPAPQPTIHSSSRP